MIFLIFHALDGIGGEGGGGIPPKAWTIKNIVYFTAVFDQKVWNYQEHHLLHCCFLSKTMKISRKLFTLLFFLIKNYENIKNIIYLIAFFVLQLTINKENQLLF